MTVGAILLGPTEGAILGGIFGLTSFSTCFGSDAFGTMLMSINPVFTFLTCVPTRVLAGWLPAVIFKALYRKEQPLRANTAFGVAALAGPVLNTVFFMGALVLFFYRTDYIQGFVTALGAANPLVFVLLFVGVQGVVEAAAGFVVSGILSRAVYPVLHRS